jgi:hypothetical protein
MSKSNGLMDKTDLGAAAPRPSTLTLEYQIFSFGTFLESQFFRKFKIIVSIRSMSSEFYKIMFSIFH